MLKKKTFRQKKKFQKGTHRYNLHKNAKATLGSGNLRTAVKLPENEDPNEWLSIAIVDFTNKLNLIYGSIQHECTKEKCPIMNAGPKYEYLWSDGKKKPVQLPAPQYIENLLSWVDKQLSDESLFPSDPTVPFPKNFKTKIVAPIFKRLFRIFGHVYYSHFDTVVEMGAEAHLNTLFKHFYYFQSEFDLIEQRELEPMADLIKKLCG
ncbi:mob kinase activator-like 1 [Anaeramoeba ignava]|uniref:Mob kinase activator-like 1 n=1 Tax=Anaeramoeba ignava TaxID=1746090 RepID=A0A9Q0LCX0_ANAIG|nr:mob kinase activator-like 1 [Anaeramoeba ignava]|eukprot:Anaeramoba_ignava/a226007_114.p1 GENE.a226007_114~~a226007_114.p1  ORF type:complete len:207 (+),score=63.79 a226007_114:11-631(+)